MGVAGDQASSSHLMSVMGAWRSLPLCQACLCFQYPLDKLDVLAMEDSTTAVP